ncbi:MAG TPA: hypothetical protein P5338_04630 [Bacteroidales bacterium]|nr:hypothetical protein [Bacteroidales bacterium]
MKPKLFTAILLFISAYSPLFWILVVKDFDFDNNHRFQHPIPVYVLLGFTALSIILLFITVATMKRGNLIGEVVTVKNRSVDLINYTIPYMVSFFGIDLSKPQDVIAITIFLLILLLLTITSKSVFMNPLLAMAGYGLYDLEYKRDGKIYSTVILSKHELHTGERYYIRSLTRFLYFVVEQENQNNNVA